MTRCKTCVMVSTRPDTAFIDGECSACISYRKRQAVDWDARRKDLLALLDRHDGRCIVPSSGGKDSTFQVIKLLELGADVTVVTATTCHLTAIGRRNIDNLARHARTIEVSPNKEVRRKLNRLGLQLVGDISWPEHVSIFTTPFKVACDIGVPLIFYGENPQAHYGGPMGADESREMTRRWVSEFGGFLGLRPADLLNQEGLTKRDLSDYMAPNEEVVESCGIEAHFLGQYVPWDSHENARIAIEHGMELFTTHIGKALPPSILNYWCHENLDNNGTLLHDWLMYLKYGYGRGCAQISVDVRSGKVTRAFALRWVEGVETDTEIPGDYMNTPISKILDHAGVTWDMLHKAENEFRSFPVN